MQLEGKVTEVSRMEKFKPADLENDISKWNDIIVQVYDELKTLLHDDQSVELQQYIIRYCKSNNLQHLLSELDFDDEEEEEKDEPEFDGE